MSDDTIQDDGLRARLARSGEDAVGKLAQELLENPVVAGTLSAAFDAREKAAAAQEVAMGALNLPSAGDLERLTRRLRSVSQRLEGIEDALDRVEDRVERLGADSEVERRLGAIERELAAATERQARDAKGAAATAKQVKAAATAAGKEAKAAATAAKAAKTAAGAAAKDARAAGAAATKAAKAKPPKAPKPAPDRALEKRLAGLESGLAGVAREVHALREALPAGGNQVSRGQERLVVEKASG